METFIITIVKIGILQNLVNEAWYWQQYEELARRDHNVARRRATFERTMNAYRELGRKMQDFGADPWETRPSLTNSICRKAMLYV